MIRVELSKCTGCRRCETACAFFHSGRINRQKSRIKVLNLYEIGLDGPILCVQCEERYCLHCPEYAMTLGGQGQVVVSPTVCTLCGVCEKLCPIGAVEIFEDIVYVCDLCGGNPKCVEACTEGAITYKRIPQQHPPSLASAAAKTKKMNPSQKRHAYLQNQGAGLRDKWRMRHA